MAIIICKVVYGITFALFCGTWVCAITGKHSYSLLSLVDHVRNFPMDIASTIFIFYKRRLTVMLRMLDSFMQLIQSKFGALQALPYAI